MCVFMAVYIETMDLLTVPPCKFQSNTRSFQHQGRLCTLDNHNINTYPFLPLALFFFYVTERLHFLISYYNIFLF